MLSGKDADAVDDAAGDAVGSDINDGMVTVIMAMLAMLLLTMMKILNDSAEQEDDVVDKMTLRLNAAVVPEASL